MENIIKNTDNVISFDPKLGIDDVVLQIRTTQAHKNPDYRFIHECKLKIGIRSYKIAVMYEIISRNTGEFKHYSLDIFSLQKQKKAWLFNDDKKFILSNQDNEIDALYEFLSLFKVNKEPKEIGLFTNSQKDKQELHQESVEDLVQSILENPDSYTTLVQAGGNELLSLLLQIAQKTSEGISVLTEFISNLKELEGGDRIEVLNAIRNLKLSKQDLDIISGRKEALEIFEKNLINDPSPDEKGWDEKDWQAFFAENHWIFGYGLDYRFLKILQKEAHIATIDVGGENDVITDFLAGCTNYTVLIELKKPNTLLFNQASTGKNRSDSWKLSSDLIDAVSQILSQKANWLIKSNTLNHDDNGRPISQKTYDPKTILIIGNTTEFSGNDKNSIIKSKTFELFRKNSKNIEILTFDELYERANFIINHK